MYQTGMEESFLSQALFRFEGLNIEPRALSVLNTSSPPSQVLFLWHQIDEAKAQCLSPGRCTAGLTAALRVSLHH